MPHRLKLETALASAEAHLKRAVLELASGPGDRSAATDKVDKARASCRDARAALKRLDHAGS